MVTGLWIQRTPVMAKEVAWTPDSSLFILYRRFPHRQGTQQRLKKAAVNLDFCANQLCHQRTVDREAHGHSKNERKPSLEQSFLSGEETAFLQHNWCYQRHTSALWDGPARGPTRVGNPSSASFRPPVNSRSPGRRLFTRLSPHFSLCFLSTYNFYLSCIKYSSFIDLFNSYSSYSPSWNLPTNKGIIARNS